MKRFGSFKITFFFISLYALAFSFATSFSQQHLPSIDLAKVKTTQLPYRLEIEKVLSNLENEYSIPVDLDDDGEDEIIVKRSGDEKPNVISLKRFEDNSVGFQANYYGLLVSGPTFFDLDGNGNKEIIFSEMKNETTFIHVLNTKGDSVFSIMGATNPEISPRDWRCEIDASNHLDVNNDGWKDLLLIVHTGYAYQPRGLFAFDLYNKKYIWKYKTGFHVQTPNLIDIDNDGKREILLGSSAPSNANGVLVNGTDDEHTYLAVVDSQGKNLKNPQTIGLKYGEAKIFVHDLSGDQKTEIIVHFRSDNIPKEKSFIAIWNPLTGNLAPDITKEKDLSSNIVFLDADRNGKDDFLVGWGDGTIEFIDCNFESVISRRYPGFVPERFFMSDLNNDAEEEIIVSGKLKGYNRVIIINRKMKLLAYSKDNFSFFEPNCIVNTGFGADKFLLARTGSETILMEMKKQSWIFPFLYWRWMGYGIILGIFFSGIAIAIFMKRRHGLGDKIRINSLINNLQEGVIILDSQGYIITINQMIEEVFKMNRENITGVPYQTVFSDSIFNELLQIIDESYQHKFIPLEKEITIFQKDKACNVLVSVASFPMAKNNDPGKLITLRNITEIVQSKRAIAWATLAQKLAHEIKTPLSTVMLTAQHLQLEDEEETGKAQKSAKHLNNIIDQVNRLRKMTDALMKFARLEEPKFEPVNINDVIIECLNENRIKMGSGIRVEKSLMKDPSIIKADRQQLHVAFQNIIDNSITAMQGKGIFTVKTTLVQSLQGDSSMVSKAAILIEIADTGRGISPAHLNQLFQPFFSKFPDGTGLGLVIVKKIIDDHQGNIKIESQEGIGTTVFITLPV